MKIESPSLEMLWAPPPITPMMTWFMFFQPKENNNGYYLAGSMSNTKIKASKDYLYLIMQDFRAYMPGANSGMTVSRFKPSEQRNGYKITSINEVVNTSKNMTITSFTTNQMDSVADLAARDLTSTELDKVYGFISEAGAYSKSR